MIAFMLGAVMPLLITVLVLVRLETRAILLAVIASLMLTATIGLQRAHPPLVHPDTRTLAVGLGTLGDRRWGCRCSEVRCSRPDPRTRPTHQTHATEAGRFRAPPV